MSSDAYATPLALRLKPSRWLRGILAVVHLAAAVTLVGLALPWAAHGGLAIAIAFSLWYVDRRFGRLAAPDSVIGLVWEPGAVWRLWRRDGGLRIATWNAGTRLFTRWAVLNLHADDGRNYPVILFSDGVDPEAFRQLRVRFRVAPYGETDSTRPNA